MPASSISLSIITATFNAADVLPRLIVSLKSQADPDFQWVVADGGSTDEARPFFMTSPASPNLKKVLSLKFGSILFLNGEI